MRTQAAMSRRSISKLKANDVEGAALAIVALEVTQPEIGDADEYGDLVTAIMEEHCPLFRVPEDARTPAEEKAATAMREAAQDEAYRMLRKLRSSKDPLFRALAGMQRMTAE